MKKQILFNVMILSVLSCGKDDFLTQVNKDANSVGVQLQSIGEHVGRMPRIVGNLILGTDADSDEDISDLQKEFKAFKKQVLSKFVSVNAEIDKLSNNLDSYNNDSNSDINALKDDLKALQDDLNDLIDSIDFDSIDDISDLNSTLETIEQKLLCAKNAHGLNSVQNCL